MGESNIKISVVLSTYNGEKHILEQLDSIRLQKRTADEVIICDDDSTDKTFSLVEDYIHRYKLEPQWKLLKNMENLGWKQSFYNLILMASGDYVFTCDQDDIWSKNKLEVMTRVARDSNALLIASDYVSFYENNSVKFPKAKISGNTCNHRLEHINRKKAILLVDRPGCTYCFSSKLLPCLKRLWFEGYPHDALVWRCAALQKSLFILHEPMIRFRRHANNASDHKNRDVMNRTEVAEYYVGFLSGILNNRKYLRLDKDTKRFIKRALLVQKKRIRILQERKMLSAIFMIMKIQYYPTINTYFADLLAVFNSLLRSKDHSVELT